MNKKEFLKICLLVVAVISTLFVIITENTMNEIDSLILFLILFVFTIPVLYLYKHKEIKNKKYYKILTILCILIGIGIFIFLGYLIASYYNIGRITDYNVPVGYETEGLDLSLSYSVSTPSNFLTSNMIIIYISLLFSTLMISFDDVENKTNKTNYTLTIIASILIIIVNINSLNPHHLGIVTVDKLGNTFHYVRQYDTLFTILLSSILIHKFINKKEKI